MGKLYRLGGIVNPKIWVNIPKGEWYNEVNLISFSYKGLTCVIERNPRYLHWCGYVSLPDDHPWQKRDHIDDFYEDVDIHGTITFCGYVELHYNTGSTKCIGFDCAHSDDLIPLYLKTEYGNTANAIYKTQDFAMAECKKLANQVLQAGV